MFGTDCRYKSEKAQDGAVSMQHESVEFRIFMLGENWSIVDYWLQVRRKQITINIANENIAIYKR